MYSVILPVLNEAENLRVLIPQLQEDPSCSEILICDKGSTDSSQEVALSLGARVSIGTGTVVDAITRGLSLETNDRVVVMDADLSHPPSLVPLMASWLDCLDVVVASRYKDWGMNHDSLKNRVLSKAVTWLSFGLAPRVSDRGSGFWAAKSESAKVITQRKSTKPLLEVLVRNKDLKVAEAPSLFYPRATGKSKIGRPLSVIYDTFSSILQLYIVKFQRPLKFCVVGGTGILLNLGVLWVLTERASLYYVVSSTLAILVATVWNYLFNNYWTFGKMDLI